MAIIGGRLVSTGTTSCLLSSVFVSAVDGLRFLKPVAMIKKLNFAAENVKKSKTTVKTMVAAEGVRDVFGRMLVVAAKTTNAFNLRHILSYPVTEVPLSLAHNDSTPLKKNSMVS